jgi:hypothetical protein
MCPTAATISVSEVLKLLDTDLAGVAAGMSRGEYVLWIGSGVSRNRVDGLPEVLRRILVFLQQRVVNADPNCRFRRAIRDMLGAAGVAAAERDAIDVALPVEQWPTLDVLITRLSSSYAKVLGVHVTNEPLDYLLWNAADVRHTYGRSDLVPDVEHSAIAVLGLEGVISQIVTANWDGLIERAFRELGGSAALDVIVTASDLQGQPAPRVRLIKFHGCAVRAVDDENAYRPLLVARQSQIDGFTVSHSAIVQALTTLLMTRPTLMIGLSAQDSNIRLLVAQAAGLLPWKWPGNPHACLFCEDELSADHGSTLERAYGGDYAANADAIRQSAVVPAFGKPILVALVLHSLTDKLCALASIATKALNAADVASLKSGLVGLRDAVADAAAGYPVGVVERLARITSSVLAVFEEGAVPPVADRNRYRPISVYSTSQIPGQYSATSGRAELAVALAVLGLGHQNGTWTLDPSSGASQGFIGINAATGPAKVFLVANEQAAIGLHDHHALDGSSVVIHSLKRAPRLSRSPVGPRGRIGSAVAREFSLGQLLSEVTTLSDLTEGLRLEAAL